MMSQRCFGYALYEFQVVVLYVIEPTQLRVKNSYKLCALCARQRTCLHEDGYDFSEYLVFGRYAVHTIAPPYAIEL